MDGKLMVATTRESAKSPVWAPKPDQAAGLSPDCHQVEKADPWRSLFDSARWLKYRGKLVGRTRFELVTNGLKVRCSTN
jgi:hypothetical protein